MENVRNLTPAPAPISGIIACGVYTAGRRIADIPIEEAGEWAKKSGHVVWIGLLEPDRN
ncbi:magnesium transporter, partial [Mesorhizobium sp. M7A.F.Ca.CA.001.14.1.1]